jgi:Mn2+/Fe2+ NRAMP family transporter
MIFFRQSACADKGLTPKDIRYGRYDTFVGGALAALFGCGALIAGAALATHGGVTIQGLAGAGFPGALRSAAGGAVATAFALGLIEAGALAVLTISASTAYAVGEAVGAKHSFNATPRRALLFYGSNVAAALIAAAVILVPGAPLLSIALNANVLAIVLLPVALVFLLMLANDRGLMGEWTNRPSTNRIAVAIIAIVTVCGTAYGVDAFLRAVHLIPA